MSNLQDQVNEFEYAIVKQQFEDTRAAHKFEPSKTDGTKGEVSTATRKIVIPVGMHKLQAAHNLLEQFKEEETRRNYNKSYQFFFINDFMVATQYMINKVFGMLQVSRVNTEGKPAQNDYIQIATGVDANGKVINEKGYVGSIIAACWDNAVLDIYPGTIIVRAKMKFEKDVTAFLDAVEEFIVNNSVIRNGAVTIQITRQGLIAIPIAAKVNKTIVLNESTHRVINNLIIPSLKEKGKKSILFTGDFGTGKTETAIKVGIAAKNDYGRTFFYLHNSETFTALIPYLKNYQPCLVFAEDVDQISSGDRDSGMNNLLNQLDGNELKNVDVQFIFTTNSHDKIHPGMRRPGRIDQLVHFDYCDKTSIMKICEAYVKDMTGANDVDYKLVAERCPEKLQGAVVAEIARRAKNYAERLHDGVISTDVFLDSLASMEDHIEFMRKDQTKDHSAENLLGHVFYKAITKAFPHVESHADGFSGSQYADLK